MPITINPTATNSYYPRAFRNKRGSKNVVLFFSETWGVCIEDKGSFWRVGVSAEYVSHTDPSAWEPVDITISHI